MGAFAWSVKGKYWCLTLDPVGRRAGKSLDRPALCAWEDQQESPLLLALFVFMGSDF